jgi:hypothetical protein
MLANSCLRPSSCAKGRVSNSLCRPRSLTKPALAAALAVGCLTAGPANAFVLNVGGQDWNVTTFTGSYNDNKSKFNTPANGGVMPWWTDGDKKQDFLIALGDSLGYPNLGGSLGPAFGASTQGVPSSPGSGVGTTLFLYSDVFPYILTSVVVPFSGEVTWAQASPVPVPGPLPILGLGAVFGYSRKLRKRIKSSKPDVISTTAV